MLTRSSRRFQLAALGIVLLTVATRLPSLLHPQPIANEAMYSVVANEIVDGGLPYVDAVERKPPLLFWTYAAIFKTAGKYNWTALHAVSLVWTLTTMAGLYVIGRHLFDRNTGLIAALLYSVFQPWWSPLQLAFNGELMMNLPIVWAYAIAFERSSSRLRPELLAAGALLCAGFLLKQPAAIAAVPLGIYLLLPGYRMSRSLTRKETIIQAVMLTAGFFAALGLVTIVLSKQDILRDAYYWTIADHSIPLMFWKVVWKTGVNRTLEFVENCLPLLIGAALAFPDRRVVWAQKHAERIALFCLLAASAIGVLSGTQFNHHYYIQLIPPLALLAAPHFSQLWSDRTQLHHWLLRPALMYIMYTWLALIVIALSIVHWTYLARWREPSETGRYLLEHSAPDDRIFVWGQAAKIYVQAKRRPASRYIESFPLTGHVFSGPIPGFDTRSRIAPGAWTNLQRDFARHPPAYIVDIQTDSRQPHPVQDFPILARLLAEQYRPVARTAEGVIYRKR